MLTSIRLSLTVLALATIGNAQDACTVRGFDDPHDVDGISIAKGAVAEGEFRTSALLYRPLSTTTATPPVLFSHSAIQIADVITDLRPMAVELAKHGATVLVLERTVLWKPRDDLANRDQRLPDCASRWLLSQTKVDLLHTTYIGPRFPQPNKTWRRYPLGFANLEQPRRGSLYVPLAESEGGYETVSLTTREGQDRTLRAVEAGWSVEVTQKAAP